MKALVLLAEGSVVQVERSNKTFPVHGDFSWIECPDDCESGWIYEDGKFSPALPDERPSIEELKMNKHSELKKAFDYASESAHCMSSVGFEIDANSTAKRDIDGLIAVSEVDGNPVMFRAYDNSFHQVDLDDLRMMLVDIARHGQSLYEKKWRYGSLIDSCVSEDELDDIFFDFDGD